MREELFQLVQSRWRDIYDQYDGIKSSQSPIIRTEWSKGIRYKIPPYYFLCHPPRGRALKQVPQSKSEMTFHYEYGFDIQNRIAVKRYHTPSTPQETFYSYAENKIEMSTFVNFQGRWLLTKLAHYILDGGLIRYFVRLSTNYGYINPSQDFPAPGQIKKYQGEGLQTITADEIWERLSHQNYAISWGYEKYIYHKKRLQSISQYILYPISSAPMEAEFLFEYTDKGKVSKVSWLRSNGYQRAVYYRRKRGETLASLAANAKQKLIATIPQMLADAKLSEPLYCLNLYYFLAKSGDYFPPTFFPGFELDRQRKLRDYTIENALYHIWWFLWDVEDDEPEHVPCEPLVIQDEETLLACERLDVEINMRDKWQLAVKIFYEICRELNQLDWSLYTPVTEDFIVYACDQTEHIRPEKSLRLCGASKEQIADWIKRGIL